jgi:hypothetical protein
MPLNDDEARELLGLLEESDLSDWGRRRRRMRAAEARLWSVDGSGNPRLTGLAELISKARQKHLRL